MAKLNLEPSYPQGKFGDQHTRRIETKSATCSDWLWPAVWMLPEQNTYGGWPSSGEIDILESRGNDPSYPAQGSNYVRSTLNYGPLPNVVNQIYGW